MQNDCNCWQILIPLSHGFKDSLGSSSGPAGSTECQRLYGVRSTDQDDINYSNIRMDGMVSHSFDRIGLVCHSRSWIRTHGVLHVLHDISPMHTPGIYRPYRKRKRKKHETRWRHGAIKRANNHFDVKPFLSLISFPPPQNDIC